MTTEPSDTTTVFNVATDGYSTTVEDLLTTDRNNDLSSDKQPALSVDRQNAVFEVFNDVQIILTSLEMVVWIAAAIKMPRWRKKYRNQLLIQISVARFLKRVIFTLMYLQDYHYLTRWKEFGIVLDTALIYIDFVIVILVFFFIKHMYDSLIIVVVEVRRTSLNKLSLYAWFLPGPISTIWTIIIVYEALNKWLVKLLICCLFRWPIIFLGTAVYTTVVYKVWSDQIRKFARSLTVVTFLLCLVINFYLFSKDVIELWCIQSFETKLVSSVSGLIMDLLILIFYILLISLEYRNNNNRINKLKTISSLPDVSTLKI